MCKSYHNVQAAMLWVTHLYEYLWVWLVRLSPQTLKFGVWETFSFHPLVGWLAFQLK